MKPSHISRVVIGPTTLTGESRTGIISSEMTDNATFTWQAVQQLVHVIRQGERSYTGP